WCRPSASTRGNVSCHDHLFNRTPTDAPWFMKFRFILLNPDDDPDQPPGLQTDVIAGTTGSSNALRYAIRNGEIVRRIQSSGGRWSRTAVANFTARIVRDLIRDDGEE